MRFKSLFIAFWALLALMLFQGARFAARTDDGGNIVLLEDQDRRLWASVKRGIGIPHIRRRVQTVVTILGAAACLVTTDVVGLAASVWRHARWLVPGTA